MFDIIIKNIKGDFWKLLQQLYVHKICEPLSGALNAELNALCAQENPDFADLLSCIEACKINPTTQRLVLLDSDIPNTVNVNAVWVFVMLLNHLRVSGIKFEILLSKEGFDACIWPKWYIPLAAVSKSCNINEAYWFEIVNKAYIANLKVGIYVFDVEGGVFYTHAPIKEQSLSTLYNSLVSVQTVYTPYQKNTLDSWLQCITKLNDLCVQSIVAVLPKTAEAASAIVFPNITQEIVWISLFLSQKQVAPCRRGVCV